MNARRPILLSALSLVTLFAMTAAPADAEGVFFIKDGKAGLGTANPKEDFHLFSEEGTAEFFVEEQSSINLRRTLFRLENNGPVQFKFSDGSNTWILAHRGSGFEINKGGTGSTQFQLEADGDGKFLGDVTANGVKLTSSREKKHEFDAVDPKAVLAKVMELPISEWSFKADRGTRHIGPMAEDFHAAFGVGDSNRHIAVTDANGVTLAAVQGLHAELQDRDEQIDALNARVQQLESLVEQLLAQ